MAATYLHDVTLLFGGSSIGAQTKGFEMAASCVVHDTTPLSTSAGYTMCIAGNRTVALTFDLMADFTTSVSNGTALDYPERLLGVNLGGSFILPRSIVLGSTVGSTAYLGNNLTTSYTPLTGEAGGLGMAKLAAVYTGKVARGQYLHPITTARSGSGAGTAIQLGAVGATSTLYAALHVVSAGSSAGDESITVKIQSDDNSGFTTATDRITFTAATDLTAQFSSVAGAITDDYWRAQWAISGTDPSFLFGVTAGIVAN